ncbi:MAG: acetylpolyamine aminohydrolase [Epsilonproteobacteria bacterium]|nr:acetylpolyamine aminohydrolase [Campylobacterota bacterium]
MKYFYPSLQALHKPSIDLSDGLPGYKHIETSDRVELILQGLLSAYEAEVVYVTDFDDAEVRTIHDDDYVDFLLAISKEIDQNAEYIPPVFRQDLTDSPLYFRGGMYCNEIGTPIGKESVKAGLNSAHTALSAATYMLQNNQSSFVLTRPPGHHAGRRRYGGYCFFNNAYLAAKKFADAGKKVAVIDIDYHIGDGSLEFACEQIPYFSLHSNIHKNYPYLDSDFKNENSYVTLNEFPSGISGEVYLQYVKKLIEQAVDDSLETIVLSLGFDTLETDYCQDEYIFVTPQNFQTIGTLFGALQQNIMILLEGGYDADNLKRCAAMFMDGFLSKKKL